MSEMVRERIARVLGDALVENVGVGPFEIQRPHQSILDALADAVLAELARDERPRYECACCLEEASLYESIAPEFRCAICGCRDLRLPAEARPLPQGNNPPASDKSARSD